MLSGWGEWESQETLNDQVTCEEKPEEMMEDPWWVYGKESDQLRDHNTSKKLEIIQHYTGELIPTVLFLEVYEKHFCSLPSKQNNEDLGRDNLIRETR